MSLSTPARGADASSDAPAGQGQAQTGAEAAERAGEVLYRTLRDRIISGDLRPGTRLSVPALAEQFQVSRSPVRDAVIRLVQEELATETMNRGAVVARVSGPELVSLYEAREALEGAAARLAARHFDPALRRRLLALLTEHRAVAEAGDFARHIDLDAAFHREMRRAARSPVLARMLDSVQGRVLIAMRSTSHTGGMVHAVDDHQAIFAALSCRDPDAAEAAARAHISRLTELLRATY